MAKRASRRDSCLDVAIVILSRAENLASRAGFQILRSAQDDSHTADRQDYSFPSSPF